MKKVFRWLDGTLNGKYVRSFSYCLNNLVSDFIDSFYYMATVVLKLGEYTVSGESPISHSDLRGIGKIAGVFPPFITAESNAGSIHFTGSYLVGGIQFTERALWDKANEAFRFYRTTNAEYDTDIITLATPMFQASFVPTGTPILGYIPEGAVVYTEHGELIPENILDSPPSTGAYYPFYGEEFLFFAESFLIEAYIGDDVFIHLLEGFQYIRYNGVSLKEFCNLTELIMEGYVKDIYFETYQNRIIVHYSLYEESYVEGKIKRLFVWHEVTRQKFKQFVLEEDVQP